jgi:hypothetical protein
MQNLLSRISFILKEIPSLREIAEALRKKDKTVGEVTLLVQRTLIR